jgi:hypothetical protein
MTNNKIIKKYIYRCSFYILPGREEEAFEECLSFWKVHGWGRWRILLSVFRSGNQSCMDLEIEFNDFNNFMDKYNQLMENPETKQFLDAYGRKYELQRAGNEIFQIAVEGNGKVNLV